MESEENKEIALKSRFAEIFITQMICAVIILAAVLIVKYFYKDTFLKLQSWYTENICTETDINEVLEINGEQNEI